jgi:hypothetical protein
VSPKQALLPTLWKGQAAARRVTAWRRN